MYSPLPRAGAEECLPPEVAYHQGKPPPAVGQEEGAAQICADGLPYTSRPVR